MWPPILRHSRFLKEGHVMRAVFVILCFVLPHSVNQLEVRCVPRRHPACEICLGGTIRIAGEGVSILSCAQVIRCPESGSTRTFPRALTSHSFAFG